MPHLKRSTLQLFDSNHFYRRVIEELCYDDLTPDCMKIMLDVYICGAYTFGNDPRLIMQDNTFFNDNMTAIQVILDNCSLHAVTEKPYDFDCTVENVQNVLGGARMKSVSKIGGFTHGDQIRSELSTAAMEKVAHALVDNMLEQSSTLQLFDNTFYTVIKDLNFACLNLTSVQFMLKIYMFGSAYAFCDVINCIDKSVTFFNDNMTAIQVILDNCSLHAVTEKPYDFDCTVENVQNILGGADTHRFTHGDQIRSELSHFAIDKCIHALVDNMLEQNCTRNINKF